MRVLVRAIVTGFGLSIGAFAFKKLSRRFGFDDDDAQKAKDGASSVTARDGVSDPGLQRQDLC